MKRTAILLMLGLFVLTLAAPYAAQAGSEGRRNTAIALEAASIYSLMKGKTTQGLLLGAGALYAYDRYQDGRYYDGYYYRPRYGRGHDYYRERYYREGRGYRDGGYYRHDNGRHRGWYKNGGRGRGHGDRD